MEEERRTRREADDDEIMMTTGGDDNDNKEWFNDTLRQLATTGIWHCTSTSKVGSAAAVTAATELALASSTRQDRTALAYYAFCGDASPVSDGHHEGNNLAGQFRC
ncbi:unnamed protein product [Haemonchus placei]|uniref:Uncharacterized protein n=1 Tax=Haemonchus placei TaxID=6290 RepID=A0A0N4X7C4_HAEPC|nr:unnamed protein product [Haemonchus placei]